MNRIYLKFFSPLCFLFHFSVEVAAQDVWTINQSDTFELDTAALTNQLKKITPNTSTIVEFPDNNGVLTSFEVFDNSLLPENLAIKYPNVHAYKGKSIEFPDLTITFTCTPRGISGALIKGAEIWSLQQIEQTNSYKVLNDNDSPLERPSCDTKLDESDNTISDFQLNSSNSSAQTLVGDNTLRILRTAIITTGEYSNFFTNGVGSEAEQKAIVLGAIVTSLNNINPVFERDLGIRFELIENNDELIFLNERAL